MDKNAGEGCQPYRYASFALQSSHTIISGFLVIYLYIIILLKQNFEEKIASYLILMYMYTYM